MHHQHPNVPASDSGHDRETAKVQFRTLRDAARNDVVFVSLPSLEFGCLRYVGSLLTLRYGPALFDRTMTLSCAIPVHQSSRLWSRRKTREVLLLVLTPESAHCFCEKRIKSETIVGGLFYKRGFSFDRLPSMRYVPSVSTKTGDGLDK